MITLQKYYSICSLFWCNGNNNFIESNTDGLSTFFFFCKMLMVILWFNYGPVSTCPVQYLRCWNQTRFSSYCYIQILVKETFYRPFEKPQIVSAYVEYPGIIELSPIYGIFAHPASVQNRDITSILLILMDVFLIMNFCWLLRFL